MYMDYAKKNYLPDGTGKVLITEPEPKPKPYHNPLQL